MRVPTKQLVVAASVCLLLSACAEQGAVRKETFPVTGQVYVDGQPAAELVVTCHDVKGLDKENPTLSSAITGQDGKFQIATYEAADGVPEGDYVLTFEWKERNLMKGGFSGPDKLNGRYTDPQKSETRFTVEQGKPTDLGQIELSTK